MYLLINCIIFILLYFNFVKFNCKSYVVKLSEKKCKFGQKIKKEIKKMEMTKVRNLTVDKLKKK